MVIARIVPMSLGKILGGLYAILGLIGGVLFAIAAEGLRSFLMFFPTDSPFGMEESSPIGLVVVLVLPLVYGAVGFVSGFVIACVYNWFAHLFGGIEREFSANDDAPAVEEQGVLS